jgi:tRNA (adenine22-N1)-methyltransferase
MLLEISDRLKTIASFIPDQAKVADIGADHAHLLIHLAREGRLLKGIAGELNKGPFANAKNRVAMAGYASQIDVRLGNGLEVLTNGEVDVFVIAGMGGALIASILEAGQAKLAGVKRLVLQPNIGSERVRRWLLEHGWQIVAETIVKEEGICYEVIVAEPGVNPTLYQDPILSPSMLLQIGPLLWKQRHPLLREFCQIEYGRKKKAFDQLKQAKSEEAKQKQVQMKKELEELERVIRCLSEEAN